MEYRTLNVPFFSSPLPKEGARLCTVMGYHVSPGEW
jgi:hypothetical protein